MSTSLETLERVWNANPGGLAFAQYAEALHRQGRSRDAHAILVDGVARWPNHFAGKVLLGRLSQELGDLDTARVAFQEAVSLDSNSPVALRSLAMVLGRQQYQRQAIDLWVRLSQLDPSDQEAASTARRLLSDLETTSSLADLGLVRWEQRADGIVSRGRYRAARPRTIGRARAKLSKSTGGLV